MSEEQGTVLQGINNIYLVETADGEILQCRIKGKVLSDSQMEYNPLAPGDRVELIRHGGDEGGIVTRLERTKVFTRWNMKKDRQQSIAANVDRVFCITSAREPAFRPRFLDRVFVCAADIPVVIVLNKMDLDLDEETEAYLGYLNGLGYTIVKISALSSGTTVSGELKGLLSGSLSVFVGQSGVGKSTLINALVPRAQQRVGEISDRYDRGRHTTNFARLIHGSGFDIIDTPGVREIEIPVMDPVELGPRFPEIRQLSGGCRFSSCLHLDEPGCSVRQEMTEGFALQRYESYVKLVTSMIERRKALFYGV